MGLKGWEGGRRKFSLIIYHFYGVLIPSINIIYILVFVCFFFSHQSFALATLDKKEVRVYIEVLSSATPRTRICGSMHAHKGADGKSHSRGTVMSAENDHMCHSMVLRKSIQVSDRR
jgi:hypothetical protein